MKKFISFLLAAMLVAAVAIGGTVAYLTQDAGKESNVFSVGNINISLDEEVGVLGEGGEVKQTEDGAEYIEVLPGDYLKKKVTVTNNGKTDAYVAVTVTLNNAKEINAAIDEFYGDEAAQEKYDDIFQGWGLNHSKDLDGDGVNDAGMRLTITGSDMPEYVMQVDSVKTIDEYTNAYSGNWFENSSVVIKNGAFPGYYSSNMDTYEICYTYYMLLPAGETTTLFKGLNVPAAFNNDQMAMFDGLEINVEAAAIQADNMAVAAQFAKDVNGKAKTAFAILAGDIEVPEDYSNKPITVDSWDGTADTSWYNDTDTTFTLTTCEQLAGMNQLIGEGVTFEGKTIQIGVNMDMSAAEWNAPVADFSGTFDGQGHAILNLHRTVNEYEQGGRMGLFGHVEGGSVKNLTLDNADFYGYGPYGGVVCGSAYGECVFESITLKNCNNEMYNTGSAGIVGLAYSDSDYTFNGINIDDSNVIGSYWGSWDTPCGGLIGYFWQNTDNVSPITVEDCYIACVMNVYNDVTANNQYYNYRRSGMLIGRVTPTVEVNGTTIPNPYMVTCNDVTVEYGEWANYRYCEWEEASSAWPHDGTTFQFYREDDNDFDSHVHTAVEDNHNVLLPFDRLFGGHSDYVYGLSTFDGVTVIYNNK